MMNVLMLFAHLRKGGPVDVAYNLCYQLANKGGIGLYVLSLRKEPVNSRSGDFRKICTNVWNMDFSYLQCECDSKRIVKRIQSVVNKYDIDIVHCHGYHPVIIGKGLKNAKLVSTLHNRANEDFINVFGQFVGKYMLNRYLKSLCNFNMNIAVSNSVAKVYREKIPNVCIVNNGINTDLYNFIGDEEKKILRKRLGLPTDSILFVSTGRVEKEKGYENLIRWFIKATHNINVGLLIVGDGSQYDRCRNAASNSKNVIFAGRVDNVSDYLKCCDYYISNSVSEGMSLAVCEGISCGLYPVLSDIPSHRDVAECINGFFFSNLNDISISKLLKIQFNPAFLHKHISDFFSIHSMITGYEEKYSQLLDDNANAEV